MSATLHPARQDLSLYQGDTTQIEILLWSVADDGTRTPLPVGAGEVYALALGPLSARTDDIGTGRLILTRDGATTRLSRTLRAAETARLPPGGVGWRLIRFPGGGQRRTYITGRVSIVAGPLPGTGDQSVDLYVRPGSVSVDLAIADNLGFLLAQRAEISDEIAGAVAGRARSGNNSDITRLSGLTTPLSVGQGGTGATTASGVRALIGLGRVDDTSDADKAASGPIAAAIAGRQPLDALLTALAGLTTAADQLIYATGPDQLATAPVTAAARALLAAANAAAQRGVLGLGTAALLAAGQPGGAATLDASTGKLAAAQIPDALLGAVRYQGAWNASTNSPALPTPAAANRGFYWIVTAAGTTALAGSSGPISDWQIGDWAVSDGTYYAKVDSSDQVISVAGLQGAITAAALKASLALAATDITNASASGRSVLTGSPGQGRAALGLPLVPGDINFDAAMTALYVTWLNGLPVASSNPDDPAPVPAGSPYKIGPGGPVVIAQ